MKHLIIMAVMALSHPASAESLSDLLMEPGLLAEVPAEELPRYTHDRQLSDLAAKPDMPDAGQGYAGPMPQPVKGEEVGLTRTTGDSGDQLALSVTEDGKAQIVAEFSIGTSNPILLFFLENVVRNISAQTGGSPYYIRNRIRDALIATEIQGKIGEQADITLHPFAKDPNRQRLGEFADLSITLRYDPGEPSRLLRLLADTSTENGGYTEAMSLISEE